MIDLKTIYEQVTMEFKSIDKYATDKYIVEVFQQPETPLHVFAYWTHKGTLHSIAFHLKERI